MIEEIQKGIKACLNNGLVPAELWIGRQGYIFYSDKINMSHRGEKAYYESICGLPVVCDSSIPEGEFYIR